MHKNKKQWLKLEKEKKANKKHYSKKYKNEGEKRR